MCSGGPGVSPFCRNGGRHNTRYQSEPGVPVIKWGFGLADFAGWRGWVFYKGFPCAAVVGNLSCHLQAARQGVPACLKMAKAAGKFLLFETGGGHLMRNAF
ncbi:MAG: hypothetical protein CVV03_06740 [Firmicutes bacterium HGW-Firmicutes-8]|nr:MAG: hypothetical protein CVV03_06740 [Firmicutes bacterium HGW-Firmicutes-8]